MAAGRNFGSDVEVSKTFEKCVQVQPYVLPGHWRIGAASTFVDRYSPNVGIEYVPDFVSEGGQLRLVLSHDSVAVRKSFPFRRRLWNMMIDRRPMSTPSVFIDLRDDLYFNWSHQINSYLPLAVFAREKLGTELMVVLPKRMPHLAEELYQSFGFQTLFTDAPVVGAELVWELSHSRVLASARHLLASGSSPDLASLPVFEKISSLPKQILIARRTTRRISNQSEVSRFLEAHGYATVYMEDYSIHEQFALVRGATEIVAIHGAGLAPLQYRPVNEPRVRLIELFPSACVSDFFARICHQVGGKYVGVLGKLKPQYVKQAYSHKPMDQFINDDFEVDLRSLKLALELVRSEDGCCDILPKEFNSHSLKVS